MTGSAADTPATPDSLRASDAERDRAIDALRQEFVDGRLSHDTFMFRMQSALGARNRSQLTGLFTDLPPRRARLLARLRAAFGRRDPNQKGPDGARTDWHPPGQASSGMLASRGVSTAGGWPAQPVWSDAHVGPDDPGLPAPMVFPPGKGTSFTIGRTHDCDLRIANLSVSRCHARLDRSEDGWLLSDLGSHNGTRVNGWLVREPVPVRPGDLLQFGTAAFLIQGRDGPGSKTPPWGGPGGYGGDGQSPP
jgi:hypothetical protein